jgi:hypothetical protein
MSTLAEHARRELELCGQYAEDPAYSESVIAAVEAFTSFGHSGGSAPVAREQLHALLAFKPLAPLTSDPAEWQDQSDASGTPMWQNRRDPAAFSTDGGQTWYSLDDGAPSGMVAHTDLPGVGLATMCVASKAHSPGPLRFVWHHLQPLEAGGQTVAENLIEICDSCHYSIHRLLWYLRLVAEGTALSPVQAAVLAHPPRKQQLAFATTGYDACVAAGTVAQIPNEG